MAGQVPYYLSLFECSEVLMMFETVNTVVFQAGEGGGNPCPVTLKADELTLDEMQSMTCSSGAESSFLMKPTRPDCDMRVKYFMPLHETDMCMHATVGSVTVLVRRGILQKSPVMFETNLGPMQVDWEEREGEIDVAVEQFLPQYMEKAPNKEEICQVLRIDPSELTDAPIQAVSTSRFKLMVPLRSRNVLDSLDPDFEALWSVCDRCEATGFYPFVLDTMDKSGTVLYARQFPNRAGYKEDPATGVAASALAAYLVRHQLVPVQEGWNQFTVFQGKAMGRPSVIYSDVFVEEDKITRTRIRGNAKIL